ncbi:MAG: acylphosphatase [Candidatus Paceibacteria bacterium]
MFCWIADIQGILFPMVEMHCIVTGVVQGVAYRTYAQESATELELVGFVQNQENGSVVVVAHGSPDVLKEFVEYLYEGSLTSKVEGVAVEWSSPNKTFDEFSVLH